jgi:hypothetical protein
MADWVTALVPVSSLAAGSLLGMLGQGLSDRRALRREREARIEAFAIKRYEHERQNLLTLQEVLEEHWRIYSDRQHEAEIMDKPSHPAQDEVNALSKVTMLNARTLHEVARLAVSDYINVAAYGINTQPQVTDRDLFMQAQDAIGVALRHDPLEDLDL